MIKKLFGATVFLLLTLFHACPVSAEEACVPPRISAESAVLIEADIGEVIYEKNALEKLPMASTTKIMTALLAIEDQNPDELFSVPRETVGVEGSSVYLTEGEKVTMRDLIYAIMLESANDAAETIAYRIGGSIDGFVRLMNEKAEELGLFDTHFTNPHGLDDPYHFTTARDLAKLTCEALKNPDFEKIVSTYSIDAFTVGTKRKLVNHNRLLKTLDGTIGVKTGFTKRSGRCLVSAVRRNGVLTVAVTLNDPNDWSDHKALHEYGQSIFRRAELAGENAVSFDIPVIGGETSRVRCTSADSFFAFIKSGQKTRMTIEADRFVPAPVRKGDALGKAVFTVDGEVVGSIPLYAENDVPEKPGKISFIERLLRSFGRMTW